MDSSQSGSMTSAPYFELPEPLTGKIWKLDDLSVSSFAGHVHLQPLSLCGTFEGGYCEAFQQLHACTKGLAVVAISSNSAETHPQDGPTFMAEDAKAYKYPFPYLYDETQQVAKAYGALCTPDFYLFKKVDKRPFELVYHGRFDDSRPRSNTPITGRDIREALDCTLSGQPVSGSQKPSIGCSIKWAPASSNI